jgi:hypothetical protein
MLSWLIQLLLSIQFLVYFYPCFARYSKKTSGHTYNSLFVQLMLATMRYFAIALWMPIRLSATISTIHDKTCHRGVHWISRRTFWAFTLNVLFQLQLWKKCIWADGHCFLCNVSGHMLPCTLLPVDTCATCARLSLTSRLLLQWNFGYSTRFYVPGKQSHACLLVYVIFMCSYCCPMFHTLRNIGINKLLLCCRFSCWSCQT